MISQEHIPECITDKAFIGCRIEDASMKRTISLTSGCRIEHVSRLQNCPCFQDPELSMFPVCKIVFPGCRIEHVSRMQLS
jgi:hypothetical protein